MNRIFVLTATAVCLVLAVPAWSAPAAVERSYPGTILASRTTQLAFRIAGPLVQVNADPGLPVAKGQLLMQVDPRDFKDNIAVLEARLEGAQAKDLLAGKDFERARTLFEQQVSASADFDRAKSAFAAAAAGVRSLAAQLRLARHQLEDTGLYAPYDGVVVTRKVENFEMVRAGEVVVVLQDIATLEVEIRVPESEIVSRSLHQGAKARFELSSLPGRRLEAQLKEWSPAADPVTRTYALRFTFPAPREVQVLPGMTADVYYPGVPENSGKQE